MSHESPDVELLESLLAAFNRHDVEDVMEFFTEDCIFETPRGPIPGPQARGQAEVREGSKRASPGFQTSTTGRTGTGLRRPRRFRVDDHGDRHLGQARRGPGVRSVRVPRGEDRS